jgi:hypothetical protein
MPVYDPRNLLHIGPPLRKGDPEITSAMAEAVRQRIEDAGGKLVVWAVLHEDVYETRYGDGFYLHVHGLALNSKDAHTLAECAGNSEWVKWHVKGYELGLENGQPAFLRDWPKEEEFSIGHFVATLAEIPPGQTSSKLLTGTGRREDGPFVELPAK